MNKIKESESAGSIVAGILIFIVCGFIIFSLVFILGGVMMQPNSEPINIKDQQTYVITNRLSNVIEYKSLSSNEIFTTETTNESLKVNDTIIFKYKE